LVLTMSAASITLLLVPLLLVGSIGGTLGESHAPVTGLVVSEFGPHVVPVDLHLSWSDPRQIPAPAWAGSLITRVHVRPGDHVGSGDPVVSVDGVARVAIVADEPPHRMIRSGDSGADVNALRSLLGGMGLGPVGEGDRFVWADLVAVRRMAEQIGVEGAQYLTAFDPGWVVWTGSDRRDLVVGRVDLLAGHPPPAMGESVFETQQRLLDVSVVPRDSESKLRTEYGVTYEIELAGVTHPVDGFEIDASWVRRVAADHDLPAGTESVAATIRATPGSTLPLVPASAIRVAADGSTCVVVVDHDTREAMPVEVVGRELTGVFVTGVSPGQQIVIADDGKAGGCDRAGA